MFKDIQKLPLKKRKAIVLVVGGIVAMILITTQFILTARRISSPDFIFFPPIGDNIGKEGEKMMTDIEETYQKKKEELWGDMPEIDSPNDNFLEIETEKEEEKTKSD